MANLVELKLTKLSSLSTLPVPAIQKFLKLTSIDITETRITSVLGDSFKPLSQLNEIKIRNNYYLTSIDQVAFSGVTDTVQYLDLDNNKLNNIDSLCNENWTVLSHVNIGYNNDLRTLPSCIFSKMPTLDYLTCNDIGLTSINKEMFTGLSNLHTLDLAYNQIKTVSTEAFMNSPSLVELRLHDQNINPELINFQENAFGGIETSLQILSLNVNKFNLTQFWIDISKLSDLKVLEIIETGIINIPDKAFRNNTKLTTLHMSGNNLTSIKQETFYGPRNTLHTIDLQRNQIQTIDQCTLNDFLIKPKLLLAGNQLNCNCDLVWLYDLFKQQGNQAIVANDIGECTLPVSLANKMFSEFSRNDMCPDGAPVRTCPDIYSTTTTSTKSQLGVTIIIASFVLTGLVIVVRLIFMLTNKPKIPPKPIADIPHVGDTARRFAKKPDKEGTTRVDYQITIISNGDMTNRARISAGSYQALNEKGVDPRLMPSSPEHYANSWEERPLPKAPYSSSGDTGHGYVNGVFKNSAEKLPETSKNEYSEVRY